MKSFNKIFAAVLVIIALIFAVANIYLLSAKNGAGGRPYRVEISRAVREIEQNGLECVHLSDYIYITNIECYNGDDQAFFEEPDSDYLVRQAGGALYRFDYTRFSEEGNWKLIGMVNILLGVMSLGVAGLLFFIRQKILKPFEVLRDVPYELSRGNLTVPIKEHKNRFFGRFVWGVDLLREHMEQQRERELRLQRDKKTLVLSISHDIKTPLSAIKLYAKALSRGLYTAEADEKKLIEVAERIDGKADEIEGYVSQIIKASSEDFLNLEVVQGEFYLSELVNQIAVYYKEKLELIKIRFSVGAYSDCILRGDPDRCIEVLQNLIENAIKYGDGKFIRIEFAEEEDCQLVTVQNSGCTLPETELPHIFDSFWRGSNAGGSKGSGLGLYICRQLMHRMDGEVFAGLQGEQMCVTAVFQKAV